jgi:hypothetical protein
MLFFYFWNVELSISYYAIFPFFILRAAHCLPFSHFPPSAHFPTFVHFPYTTEKTIFKTTCPTGPQHSPLDHPKPLRLVTYSSMPKCSFERHLFSPSTSLMITTSVVVISSSPCVIKFVGFSSASTTSYLTLPCTVANSPITHTASSCSGPSLCCRIFC